jgi:hypothetical protein
MTTDRDPDRRGKVPPHSPSAVDEEILLDLANALTALGNHLALAIRIRLREAQSGTQRLDQVLEKSREQHERSVWALRELQKALQK